MDYFLPIDAKQAELNNTFAAYPKETSLTDLIRSVAGQFPDKVAIKYNTQSITYQELEHRSNQIARLLIDKKIQIGDTVGIAVDRSGEMVITLLAIMKTGASYVPLDPNYPLERINFMLNDSSAKLFITSEKYLGQFNSSVEELLIEDAFSKIESYSKKPIAVKVDGNCLAYILYTSGSTGLPKGVKIVHHSLVNFLLSMQKFPGMNASDKLLAVTTISFDIAGLELYLPLLSGAQLVITDAELVKDGREILRIIDKEGISFMQATPYTWRMMMHSGWKEVLPIKALCGGEPLPIDLAQSLCSKCQSVFNMYGPTETTIWSTVKQVVANDDVITVGRPIDNTQIYILDEELNPVPNGQAGEIFIGGDGVAVGYLNRDELTEERFINNPFSTVSANKMYRTGDLGKFTDDAEIVCLGRIDQQIKIRGYRIEAGEIEFALISQSDINEAAVIARDDHTGNKILSAYIVASDHISNTKPKIENWREALQNTLPDYMVPRDFTIIATMPLTPNGKVDRKALPLQPSLNINNDEYIAPFTPVEKIIAEIWQKHLHLNKISVHDSFFDLGGHSLISVQVMSAIEKKTGIHLPLSSLFANPTIKKLSLLLEVGGQSVNWNSLVPIKPTGKKLPLYIVHGDGLNVLAFNQLASRLDTDQPVFGLEPKGLNGVDEPIDNLPGIAKHYIDAILKQNPIGPYLLAGYSFGGYVAVEMRKQLAEMGKEVKMLILFDTNAEEGEPKSWHFLLPRKLKHNLPKFLSVTQSTQLLKIMFNKSFPKKESNKFYELINKVNEKHNIAFANYKLEPFDDKVHLYKADVSVHYVYDTKFLGWMKYAKNGVELHHVPGDHLSMLLSPNVEEFASKLQHTLDTAC